MIPAESNPIPAAEPTRVARPRRVEVVVLGNDEFLIEIGPLLGDQFRTRPVDSPASVAAVVADQAQGGDAPPSMIMLDAGAVADARGAVAQLETAHPHMPVIVIAASRDESYWGSALARGAIIDVVARDELSSDRFREAVSRAETRARNVPKAQPPGGEITAAPKGSSKLLIAAAVAVALGAGAFFMLQQSPAPATVKAPVTGSIDTAQHAAAIKAQSSVELLSAARIAFRDQKLLPRTDGETRGDSALELYAQVLAQDPKNDEAIDGVQRLFSVVKSRVQGDLSANKLDDAQKVVVSFKSTGVNPDGVHDLDAMISAARPKYYAAKAQEALTANDFATADQMISQLAPLDRVKASELSRAMEGRKAEQQANAQLSGMSAQVKAAIEAGNLLEPASDNARTRLNAMRQISHGSPLTLGAQKDLQSALLARAQDQSSKEQFDGANKLLTAAADIALTPEVADAKKQLQGQMDAANQRAAAAAARKAAEQAQAAAAQTPAAAPTSAAATSAAAQGFIAARPVTPIRLSYPPGASDRTGYVIVDFMLQPDGRPAQPTVIESSPPKVFDSEAIDAVMSGRFDTSKLTDKIAKHARIRLTFKPN